MRNLRLAAATAGTCLIAALISACGGSTGGDPSLVPTTSSDTGATHSSTSTTHKTSSQNPVQTLENTKPCDLLSKHEVEQLGLTDENRSDSVKSRGCSWHYGTASVGVAIRAHQSIDTFHLSQAQGGKAVKPIKINGRAAKEQPNVSGGCAVTVRVTNTSRVDVQVQGLAPSKSCAAARQVAEVVETHLPGM